MPYTIKKSDGTILTSIPDGAIDSTSTSLNLVGKNTSGYGTYQNDNFVVMLENFANAIPPIVPVVGQIWFDNTPSVMKLKVYDGTNWKGVSNNTVATAAPTTPTVGDLWYNSNTKEFKIYNGFASVSYTHLRAHETG
jgi:hypothetical protein